jgi:7-cyano-7-deazaguanine reductase
MKNKMPEFEGLTPEPESSINPGLLTAIDYRYRGREIGIKITTREFTSLCPLSGLPDFAKITITYIPDKKCVELKSLKYYLFSYRNVGIFYEHVVNRIAEDLVKVLKPKRLSVLADFTTRGGIKTSVICEYSRGKGFKLKAT